MRRTHNERINLFRQFGGSLLGVNGNSREARPLSAHHSVHLVMRSQVARGTKSMRHKKHRRKIDRIVQSQARRWKIRIYEYANVGNHLHMLVRPRSRQDYCRFIRATTGLIARTVMKSERGRPQRLKFWDSKPFSRVVRWGKAFQIAKKYVRQNENEARSGLTRQEIQILEEEFHRPPVEVLQKLYGDSA